MIHWILKEGSSDLDALAVWDGFDRPAPLEIRPSSELVQGLEATGRAIQQALDIWTVADFDHAVEWRYGDELYAYTRQQISGTSSATIIITMASLLLPWACIISRYPISDLSNTPSNSVLLSPDHAAATSNSNRRPPYDVHAERRS